MKDDRQLVPMLLWKTMAKRIVFVVVAVLALAVVATYAYSRYRIDRRYNGGEVLSDDDGGKVTGDDGVAPGITPSRSDTQISSARPAQDVTAAASPARTQPVNTAPPSTDSVPFSPPNRADFAGTGRFQVYRQGDLTWRLNTDTGSTCVLFATLEEWKRPIVYRNACTAN